MKKKMETVKAPGAERYARTHDGASSARFKGDEAAGPGKVHDRRLVRDTEPEEHAHPGASRDAAVPPTAEE